MEKPFATIMVLIVLMSCVLFTVITLITETQLIRAQQACEFAGYDYAVRGVSYRPLWCVSEESLVVFRE